MEKLKQSLTSLHLRSFLNDHNRTRAAVVSVPPREIGPRVRARARSKGEILLFLPLITFLRLAHNARELQNVKVRAFHKLITLTFQYLQLLVQLTAPGIRLSEDPGSNPGYGTYRKDHLLRQRIQSALLAQLDSAHAF